MDLEAVRTFVAAADAGQFQEAGAALAITQQAVSKRVAALEQDLSVRLFTRSARGVQLTVDGQAFLPHARELLRVADRADASVRPGRRPLRVDVHSRRIAPAVLLQDFHRAHPNVELAAAFGLTIDVVGPGFGNEVLLAEIAGSASLSTLVGEHSRYLWPDSWDLRRIPVRDPAPVYPISLVWRADNPHPALGTLRQELVSRHAAVPDAEVWLPQVSGTY
ncbi:LysR family transcriptional regulator [Asanoa sp. NPDC049518]|uniref:LysR family transcriptional regulator n=1 Tax=unclassified Asanoa TaxID=2685164 RepID=UPI00341FCDDE